MRSLPRIFITLVLAVVVVIFCFFSHAQSMHRLVANARPVVYSARQTPAFYTPPFFENMPSVEPESLPRDTPTARRIQLALARICISEAGFQTRTNDCNMIYHALRTRSSTGEITMGIMRAYAPLSFNLDRTDNHRWVAHLRPDFREPHGWNETTTLPWSTRREGFRSVYEHAGKLLRTRPENPCGIRIDHWGARYFRRNTLLERGWIPIECGETLNQFWSIPVTPDATGAGSQVTIAQK